MPTNEERREVTRKLREFSDEGMWSEFSDFCNEVGPGKLADLIEPQERRFCRSCGYPLDGPAWTYCPSCGEKVVE